MKRSTLTSILVFIFHLLSLDYKDSIMESSFCDEVFVSTNLKNWHKNNGKRVYVNSGKWDEYDENGSANPFPDSMDVIIDIDILSFYLKHSFEKNDYQLDDFNVSMFIKLKTSETTDCVNLLNPSLTTNKMLLQEKKISYKDFFKFSKYKPIKIKKRIAFKSLVKELISDDDKYLAQIVITIIIKDEIENKQCIFEYSKPTC